MSCRLTKSCSEVISMCSWLTKQILKTFHPRDESSCRSANLVSSAKNCAQANQHQHPTGDVCFPFQLQALCQASQNMGAIRFSGTCQQIHPYPKQQFTAYKATKTVGQRWLRSLVRMAPKVFRDLRNQSASSLQDYEWGFIVNEARVHNQCCTG